MGSIVATETSTVTFISVPGYAFAGNFTFLQLVFGYLIGRVIVSVLFVPAYFRGELLTVYQLLGERFGTALKRLASALFLDHALALRRVPPVRHRPRAGGGPWCDAGR